MKKYEMNYSLFCKSYLVLILTFITGTPILCWTTTDAGIFWYCSRDFWSCICESPGHVVWCRFVSRRTCCVLKWFFVHDSV